jgi:hypothetical protein
MVFGCGNIPQPLTTALQTVRSSKISPRTVIAKKELRRHDN